MKYLLIIAIFTVAATLAFGKTIKDGDTEYQCAPVKTCDERLKLAYAEIAKLKKQLKQSATVVTKTEIVEKVVETTNIKKQIVSVMAHKSTLNIDTNNYKTGQAVVAETIVETAYVPMLIYQYQFDMGLTTLIGLDITSRPSVSLGLGYEL